MACRISLTLDWSVGKVGTVGVTSMPLAPVATEEVVIVRVRALVPVGVDVSRIPGRLMTQQEGCISVGGEEIVADNALVTKTGIMDVVAVSGAGAAVAGDLLQFTFLYGKGGHSRLFYGIGGGVFRGFS